MRVKGNIYPELITVEPYLPARGKVEVRVRENVREVNVAKKSGIPSTTFHQFDIFFIANEMASIVKEYNY